VYAGQYLTEVAGLVVIASAPEDWRTRMPASFVERADKSAGAQRRQFDLLPLAARMGLLRFFGFQSYFSYLRAHMPPEIAASEISFLRRGKPFQTVRAEEVAQDDRLPAWSFGDQPLIVLDDKWQLPEHPTADDLDAERVWRALNENVARRSVRGKLIVTEQSGHMIPLEQPEAVVAAVRNVVEQVRQEHGSGSFGNSMHRNSQ
jgi:pimeloyl-ACP methyl ester carboxylesterase